MIPPLRIGRQSADRRSARHSEEKYLEIDPRVRAVLKLNFGYLIEAGIGRNFSSRQWKEIGDGTFSKVYSWKSRDQSFCLKLAKKGVEHDISFKREFELAQKCENDNVVGVYDYGKTKDGREYIVQELGTESLFDYIVRHETLDEDTIYSIFSQIVSAVSSMHKKGIIHRDIKPENIFAFPEGQFKLGDFGFAKEISGEGPHTPRGSQIYGAPEIVTSRPFDHTADHWSIGVTLYALAFNRVPYVLSNSSESDRSDSSEMDSSNRKERDKIKLLLKVANENYSIPEDPPRSEELVDLIKRLMEKSKEKRLGANECREITNHPWMLLHARKKSEKST